MKATYGSINWGKGMMLLTLAAVLALLVVSLGMLTQSAAPDGVGVDWGNRCPPKNKKCNHQGVDWGNLRAPCLPTDSNCGSGPVAVDWGDLYGPDSTDKPPVRKVGFDWDSKAPRDPQAPACFSDLGDDSDDRKCAPGSSYSVDWGS